MIKQIKHIVHKIFVIKSLINIFEGGGSKLLFINNLDGLLKYFNLNSQLFPHYKTIHTSSLQCCIFEKARFLFKSHDWI